MWEYSIGTDTWIGGFEKKNKSYRLEELANRMMPSGIAKKYCKIAMHQQPC